MLDERAQQQLDATVRTSQIILAALAMGIVMFAGVVLLAIPGDKPAQGNLLSTLAIAMGATNLVLSLVVPGVIAGVNRRKIASGTWLAAERPELEAQTDFGRLAMVYQVKMIIGAALLEGGCFLALCAYMIERQLPSLAVTAVLLAALLAHFPTRGRVETWIEDQLRRVDEERRFRQFH
jgi:uncharacterized membrane protein